MRPCLNQKWLPQFVFRQIEGVSEAVPFLCICTSQRGFTPCSDISSSLSPHPHGHLNATLQISLSSTAINRLRDVIFSGIVSPSIYVIFLFGQIFDQNLKSRMRNFISLILLLFLQCWGLLKLVPIIHVPKWDFLLWRNLRPKSNPPPLTLMRI